MSSPSACRTSSVRMVSAVRRRRASRSLSPDSSSNTPRCLRRNCRDSPKENERAIKRLCVWLSSRFCSAADEAEPVGQYRSDPEEDASLPQETNAVDPVAAVRFSQLRSRRKAPLTHITQDAVPDLTLIGDFSKGAVNLYTESQIQQAVHQASAGAQILPCAAGNASSWRMKGQRATLPSDSLPEEEGSSLRKLIIFHCEFSSERGPHLCQYLRRLDRRVNVYPSLLYPELYLLLEGYRLFHASYPDLCDPCGYVPMCHREYREQLHRYRRKRPTRQRRRRPIRIHHRTTC